MPDEENVKNSKTDGNDTSNEHGNDDQSEGIVREPNEPSGTPISKTAQPETFVVKPNRPSGTSIPFGEKIN